MRQLSRLCRESRAGVSETWQYPNQMAKSDLYPPDERQSARFVVFTANGLQSRPNRRDDAPSDPRPKLPLVSGELPNFPAPRRSRFRSIANNRPSKCILAPVLSSGFRCGLGAELSSPKPHEPAPSLSLPASSLSSLLWLALLRSRSMPMASISTGKDFSSSYASITDSLCVKQAALSKVKVAWFD